MKRIMILFLLSFMMTMGVQAEQFWQLFNNGADLTGWQTDRYAPASFLSVNYGGDYRLKMTISENAADRAATGLSGTFYNTHGRQIQTNVRFPAVIRGKIYIPAAWLTVNHRRSDIWGVLANSLNEVTDYPIIGFANTTGSNPTFRVWDQDLNNATGDWVNVSYNANGTIAANQWYDLKMVFSATDIKYYINNTLVYTDNTVDATSTQVKAIIVQGYNFGDPSLPVEQQQADGLTAGSTADNYDIYWDDIAVYPTTNNVLNSTRKTLFTSIQTAINNALINDVIEVFPGHYDETLVIPFDKTGIDVIGGGSVNTVLDASSAGEEYGVEIRANNVTFSGFEIIPASSVARNGYTMHVSNSPNIISALTLKDLKVDATNLPNQQRTAFDIHGVTNPVLENITAIGCDYGVGVALTGCVGGTYKNITTSGNAWGGLAVYVSTHVDRGSNVAINMAINDIRDFLYVEDESNYTNIATITGNLFGVNNQYNAVAANGNFTAYLMKKLDGETLVPCTNDDAMNLAIVLNTKFNNNKSYCYDAVKSNYYVKPGLSIQTAINAAAINKAVRVNPGHYDETLVIDKNGLDVIGSGPGISVLDASASSSTYGVEIKANDVVFTGFEMIPPSSATGNTKNAYTLHTSPYTLVSGSETVYNPIVNLTLKDLKVDATNSPNLQRTAIDIHGVNNPNLDNITAIGCDWGVGVALSGCVGGTYRNITTSGNAWGGMAVYVSTYVNRGSNVSISMASNDIRDFLYVEDENGLTNTAAISYHNFGINNQYATNAADGNFTAYLMKKLDGETLVPCTYDDAMNLAITLNTKFNNKKSYCYDAAKNNYFVKPNLTIQAAIDGALPAKTIKVFPGDYYETAANRSVYGTGNNSYQFGLSIEKPVVIKGVDANGVDITNYNNVLANITTNSTANFGPSGIMVQANNVTLQGLKIGDNIVAGSVNSNKTIEVVGDNFNLNACQITTSSDQGCIYFGVWDDVTTHPINNYSITNSKIENALISINNGVGLDASRRAYRKIQNNTFEGTITPYIISFRGWSGENPAQGWIVRPVGGAVITGNKFNNTEVNDYISTRANLGGIDTTQINWYEIWNSNTYPRKVVALDPTSTANIFKLRPYSVSGSYPMVKRISAKIQENIDIAIGGDLVRIGAGNYTENFDVNKSISITGAGNGTDPLTSTIITQTGSPAINKLGVMQLNASGIAGAPIVISNIRLLPVGMAGISVGRFCEETGTNLSYINLTNVKVIGTNQNPSSEQERGFYVDNTSSISNMTISYCAFDNLTYGWYFQKKVSAEVSNASYLNVSNTTFNNNIHKGIYVEKLSNSTFNLCSFKDNGLNASILPSNFAPWSCGADLNLKAGTYSTIAFTTCTITGNGIGGAKEGAGIAIKARNDGTTYGAYPATLAGVTISGCIITGNERGIRIGEPGKNHPTPTAVNITNCTINSNRWNYNGTDGTDYGDVVNMLSAPITLNGVSILSGQNVWYVTDANTSGFGEDLQPIIDKAQPGDLMYVAKGEYAGNIIINKSLDLRGPNYGRAVTSRYPEAVIYPSENDKFGEIIKVQASDVSINGFTIDGDNPNIDGVLVGTSAAAADINAAEGITVYTDNVNNLKVRYNIIKNVDFSGVTIYGNVNNSAPATTGHDVSYNWISNLGTYDDPDDNPNTNMNKWGIGVLVYNDQYTKITYNKIEDVRIGIQTGNFRRANPAATPTYVTPLDYQLIDHNTIQARRRGIFYNLHYGQPAQLTLSNNTITALDNVNEVKWNGILFSSLSITSGKGTGNIINGDGFVTTDTRTSSGYEVWNVKADAPALISGGTVSGVDNCIFLNNFEGYSSYAGDGAHATISSITLNNKTNGTGIRLLDSPSAITAQTDANLRSNVQATLGSSIIINDGANGLVVENPNAKALATSATASLNLSFKKQSENYIKLVNNSNDLLATSVSFDGKAASAKTMAELYLTQQAIWDKRDNYDLGLVTIKLPNTNDTRSLALKGEDYNSPIMGTANPTSGLPVWFDDNIYNADATVPTGTGVVATAPTLFIPDATINYFNGNKAVTFTSATNTALTLPYNNAVRRINNLPTTDNGKTLFAYFRTGSNISSKQVIFEAGGSTSGMNLYVYNNRLYMGSWNATQRRFFYLTIATNTNYLVVIEYKGTGTGTVKVQLQKLNSVEQAFSGYTADADPNGIGACIGSSRFYDNYITNTTPAATYKFTGHIAELLCFNYWSSGIKDTVLAYIDAKYGTAYNATSGSGKYGDLDAIDVYTWDEGQIETITETGLNVVNETSILNVSYAAKEAIDAKLNLYDLTGSVVKSIYNGTLNKGINYYSVSTDELSSGVYYLVAETNSGVETKQVVIVK